VHQTFPTKRWEAQFRRNGKPTSLGCFDHEEEAAKAYDKMTLWCDLHQSSSMRGGILNFSIEMYASEIPMLKSIDQDELLTKLRREGRTQAAQQAANSSKQQNDAQQSGALGGNGSIYVDNLQSSSRRHSDYFSGFSNRVTAASEGGPDDE
jgi:hypothetical protein